MLGNLTKCCDTFTIGITIAVVGVVGILAFMGHSTDNRAYSLGCHPKMINCTMLRNLTEIFNETMGLNMTGECSCEYSKYIILMMSSI